MILHNYETLYDGTCGLCDTIKQLFMGGGSSLQVVGAAHVAYVYTPIDNTAEDYTWFVVT